jgi:DNA-binding response OmpR family regulator
MLSQAVLAAATGLAACESKGNRYKRKMKAPQSTTLAQPTVLVVDDEVKILEVVKSYLQRDGYRALTAENGRNALVLLEENEVSLLLLDLMLPDLSGEEICKRVRSYSDMPIIMMTAKVEEENIIHGLNLGADDYVTKPFSPRQLMARVAAVLRRSAPESENSGQVFNYGNLTVDTENRRVSKNNVSITLTANEYKILSLLASRPQKIFTRDEMLSALSADGDSFDRTIDVHVKNLRQKIEDDPKTPQYIITVYGMGYRFGGEVP